jgi:hypothetical protein
LIPMTTTTTSTTPTTANCTATVALLVLRTGCGSGSGGTIGFPSQVCLARALVHRTAIDSPPRTPLSTSVQPEPTACVHRVHVRAWDCKRECV